MTLVFLALGSNLGNREEKLQQAVNALGQESIFASGSMILSSFYESPALLPKDAEESWNLPYVNMALSGETSLLPEVILTALQSIEMRLGKAKRGHWGPREIDIDIIAYGDAIVRTERLRLPHPEMLHRDFVMLPLAEIAGNWRYPFNDEWNGFTVQEICRRKFADSSLTPLCRKG